MTRREILTKLEPWLSKHRRPGWKPIVENGDGSPTASKFCGTPWIGPDAHWPDCGVCHKPLKLFLQLDLTNLPPEIGQRFGTGLLQLFYCTQEDCQGNGGWEPFADDLSRVRVVQPDGRASLINKAPHDNQFVPKCIIGWSALTELPSPSEHDELGLKYEYDFKAGTLQLQCPELDFEMTYPMEDLPAEEIAISEVGDKLSGWPHWVQGVEYPKCPRCQRQMVHLFQVDSDDNIPFMFGDVGCGHITQCPDHKEVVAFGWACS